MGILDKYKEDVVNEKENKDFPDNSHLNESQRKAYEKKLDELRHDPKDIKNIYHAKMAAIEQMTEENLLEKELILDENITKIVVKHAYCKECKEELISNVPPMFNPFTLEKVCKHTCKKCGKVYNLEYAYPRLAFINIEGKEIPAFAR